MNLVLHILWHINTQSVRSQHIVLAHHIMFAITRMLSLRKHIGPHMHVHAMCMSECVCAVCVSVLYSYM